MPETKWDRFESAVNRAGDDMDFRDIAIRQWVRNYNESTGKYDYPDTPTVTKRMKAELVQPSDPPTVTGPDGDTTEADVNVYLPLDDINPEDIIGVGTEERPTVIEDEHSGVMYTVTSAFRQNNGLYMVSGVER